MKKHPTSVGSPHDGKVFLNPTHQFRRQLLFSDKVNHSIDSFLELNDGVQLVGKDGCYITQTVTKQQQTNSERATCNELFTRRAGMNVSIPELNMILILRR